MAIEIYDQNVVDFGLPAVIRSVDEAEFVHRNMVSFNLKNRIGDWWAMPHYRGEQKFGWDLDTNLFRVKGFKEDKLQALLAQRGAVREFEAVIRANFGDAAFRNIFNHEKFGKDWDMLFQAQHAGVKTCLLDWSPAIYAPLFFCTEESDDPDSETADAQFWVYMTPFAKIRSHNEFPVKNTFYEQDPYSMKEGCLVNVSVLLDDLKSRAYETRMYRQKGRFYLSEGNSLAIPMNKQPKIVPRLFRFRVPAEKKATIREELTKRKINRAYLYGMENPDHQALIDKINRQYY